jgi:hypothetical protein
MRNELFCRMSVYFESSQRRMTYTGFNKTHPGMSGYFHIINPLCLAIGEKNGDGILPKEDSVEVSLMS